jgi:hypothetical protein
LHFPNFLYGFHFSFHFKKSFKSHDFFFLSFTLPGTLDYIAARNRIDDVAKFTAKFIDFLHFNGYLQFKQLHVVGHSLG